VDEFLVHEVDNTNIQDGLHDCNDLTPSLKFTVEEKANNKIHFLDVIISRGKNIPQVTIYRKPTTTNMITPNDTCHPLEFELAGL
jgi:hypothetical protein